MPMQSRDLHHQHLLMLNHRLYEQNGPFFSLLFDHSAPWSPVLMRCNLLTENHNQVRNREYFHEGGGGGPKLAHNTPPPPPPPRRRAPPPPPPNLPSSPIKSKYCEQLKIKITEFQSIFDYISLFEVGKETRNNYSEDNQQLYQQCMHVRDSLKGYRLIWLLLFVVRPNIDQQLFISHNWFPLTSYSFKKQTEKVILKILFCTR